MSRAQRQQDISGVDPLIILSIQESQRKISCYDLVRTVTNQMRNTGDHALIICWTTKQEGYSSNDTILKDQR